LPAPRKPVSTVTGTWVASIPETVMALIAKSLDGPRLLVLGIIPMMSTAETTKSWIERWDRQQELYIPRREERFEVMATVLDHLDTIDASAGLRILDLACGPAPTSASTSIPCCSTSHAR
jgi:hypothetical protein